MLICLPDFERRYCCLMEHAVIRVYEVSSTIDQGSDNTQYARKPILSIHIIYSVFFIPFGITIRAEAGGPIIALYAIKLNLGSDLPNMCE